MKKKMKKALLFSLCLGCMSMGSYAATAGETPEAPTYNLNGIIVTESRYSAYAVGATKFNQALVKTPFSVSVMNERELTETGATSLTDALDYFSGVLNSVGDYPLFNYSRIRGFDVNHDSVTLNGAKAFISGTTYFSPEINGLESATIVKGPTSVLHGSGTPGGSIDLQLKKTQNKDAAKVSLQFGNRHRSEQSFDINKVLSDKAVLRLIGLHRKYDLNVDYSSTERFYFAPTLTLHPTTKDEITIDAFFQNDTINGDDAPLREKFAPASNNPDHDIFKIDPHTFYGVIGYDGLELSNKYFGTKWIHSFTPELSLTQKFAYSHVHSDLKHTEPFFFLPKKGFLRPHVETDSTSEALNLDTYLTYDWKIGNADNTTILGYEIHRDTWDSKIRRANLPFWSISDILEGKMNRGVIDDSTIWLNFPIRSGKIWERAAYLQHNYSNGPWNWLSGVRLARYYTDDEVTKATTWQTGLSYDMGNGFHPYANASTSFEPNNGKYDINENMVGPTTGHQLEVGLKYQKKNSPSYWTLAFFTIKKNNFPVLLFDKTRELGRPVFEVVDAKESTGVEWEGFHDLTKNLSARFAYTYTNARYKGLAVNAAQGIHVGSVPHHAFSIWFDTETALRQDAPWNIGFGLRYLGSRYSDDNDYRISPVLLVDASLRYKIGKGELNFQARNIFNKKTITAVRTYSGIPTALVGDERTFYTTYTYKW